MEAACAHAYEAERDTWCMGDEEEERMYDYVKNQKKHDSAYYKARTQKRKHKLEEEKKKLNTLLRSLLTKEWVKRHVQTTEEKNEEKEKHEKSNDNRIQFIPITKKGAHFIIDKAEHITLRLNNHTLTAVEPAVASPNNVNNTAKTRGPIVVTLRKLEKPIQKPEGYMVYHILNGDNSRKMYSNAATQTKLEPPQLETAPCMEIPD